MAWLVSEARVLAAAEVASTRADRRRGLRGREHVDGALVITPCRWVHTVGMQFEIDVAHVDAEDTVVKVCSMPRHRVGLPVLAGHHVIEAERGAFERWGLRVGDVVEIRETDES